MATVIRKGSLRGTNKATAPRPTRDKRRVRIAEGGTEASAVSSSQIPDNQNFRTNNSGVARSDTQSTSPMDIPREVTPATSHGQGGIQGFLKISIPDQAFNHGPEDDQAGPAQVSGGNAQIISKAPGSRSRSLLSTRPGETSQRDLLVARDFALHEYMGWKIAGPKIQLRRAINFLADEDIDRTPGWERKCAALTEYFSHLLASHKDEDWGQDLAEAIRMLRTHRLFERYHYEQAPLSLDFVYQVPAQSTRLPRQPGPDIVLNLGYQGLPQRPEAVRGSEEPIDDRGSANNSIQRDFETEDSVMEDSTKPVSHPIANQRHQASSRGSKSHYQLFDNLLRPLDGKRATAKHSLDQYGNTPSSEGYSHWHTLVLQNAPASEKPDAGILISIKAVEEVSKTESRDPLSFVRLHEEYKMKDLEWAFENERHSDVTKVGRQGVPIPTTNWKGPKIPSLATETECHIFYDLKRYRGVYDALQRQAKRAPRKFLVEVLRNIDLGKAGEKTDALGLRFRASEFASSKKQKFLPLDTYETQMFNSLCQQSYKLPQAPDQPIDEKGKILAARIVKMLADPSPSSFFRNNKRRLIRQFVSALNEVCGGPVLQHEFTEEEVSSYIDAMTKLGLIESAVSKSNTWISRPHPDIHPEDRAIWPQSLAMEGLDIPPNPRPRGQTESLSGNDLTSDYNTASHKDLPLLGITRSLQECVEQKAHVDKYRGETDNFFYCLAFRFGLVMGATEKEVERLENDLQHREARKRKAEELDKSVDDGWSRLQAHQAEIDRTSGSEAEAPTYKDVVVAADPENYGNIWGADGNLQESQQSQQKQVTTEGHCRKIVGRNIILEAYENRTMLWPSNLRTFKGKDGKEVSSYRREPIWTFGHPSVQKTAPRFWSLDRWPLELQSMETQKKIRASGPVPPAERDEERTKAGHADASGTGPYGQDEMCISYAELTNQKRHFRPGPVLFRRGDTPRQKKAFENWWRRIESRQARKRTWRDFLSLRRREDESLEDKPLKLPDLPKDQIPRSIPWLAEAEDDEMQDVSDEEQGGETTLGKVDGHGTAHSSVEATRGA